MEIENKKLLEKNLNRFEIIVNCFFSKKDLSSWNYRPEYLKFEEELKKNIKELKPILEQEKSEDICNYIYYLQRSVSKIELHNLNKISVVLKRMHYTNIAEYLRFEKEKPKFKTFIYKCFFKELEENVEEHLLLKSRIYPEYEINKDLKKE